MIKTYDAILLPTGETTAGDKTSFPVSHRAAQLYKTGNFGGIYVTGGHGGFAKVTLGETVSEARETVDFLCDKQGIPEDKVWYDGRSLDTLGNFTFPEARPLRRNPRLSDFNKMLVFGQEGHMWRAADYISKVLPRSKYDIETMPGKHNDGLVTSIYHAAFMRALKHITQPSPEEAHAFLLNHHPFYSEGWYNKTPTQRKIQTTITGLSWFARDFSKK